MYTPSAQDYDSWMQIYKQRMGRSVYVNNQVSKATAQDLNDTVRVGWAVGKEAAGHCATVAVDPVRLFFLQRVLPRSSSTTESRLAPNASVLYELVRPAA